MVHLNKIKENDYIVFDDENDKKYFEFNEARTKLDKMIDKLNGKYSDTAIKFSVFSHYCMDIKVVDLPGISNTF